MCIRAKHPVSRLNRPTSSTDGRCITHSSFYTTHRSSTHLSNTGVHTNPNLQHPLHARVHIRPRPTPTLSHPPHILYPQHSRPIHEKHPLIHLRHYKPSPLPYLCTYSTTQNSYCTTRGNIRAAATTITTSATSSTSRFTHTSRCVYDPTTISPLNPSTM